MNKISLLMILQIALFTGSAQKNDPVELQRAEAVNLRRDTQQYKGYTIRLIPVMHSPQRIGSYSFDILQDNRPVMPQVQNPLLFSPKGIQKKEDAYKIAQWMITGYIKTGRWRNVVPPHIARELKIETH